MSELRTGTVIRLHIGNVYRDLSVSYARILAGIIKNAADRLEQKRNRNTKNL